jgi:glycerophosphoryl diester phosphodiesterase
VRVIGHRGARARAPENTMASLRRALADGADGVEFDVRALADGTPVLMHDASVERTTDGRGALADFDHATIARLDAGKKFDPAFAGERVPLLANVLAELAGRTQLAIEMKEALPPSALDLVARAHAAQPAAPMILASFRIDAVARARGRLPDLPRALILPEGQGVPSVALARELGLWGVFAPDRDVDEGAARTALDRGLTLWVYTVNDVARAEQLAGYGAAGLITDDPALLRARFARET